MRQLLALTVCLWAWRYATAQVLSVPSQYGTIAAAIAAAAPGQIVEIAPGTYFEHDLDFAGKAITVRGVGPAAGVVINAQSAGRGFQFRSGEGPSSVLDGVTIRNGLASETIGPAFSPHGGGIAVIGAAARIENCLLESCRTGGSNTCQCDDGTAGNGGGIWINASGVLVSGTTVRLCNYPLGPYNASLGEPDPTGYGCGIFAVGTGITIDDCNIELNGLVSNGTRITNRGRGTNAVIAPAVGELLTLTIDSPGGTFDGLPVAVAAQGFSAASPIASNPAYPFIHLSTTTAALLLIEPALAPAGFTVSATTPAGLGGFVTRIQAFVAGPNVQNGIVATKAAHDIVWP